jgi:hypothetical protein
MMEVALCEEIKMYQPNEEDAPVALFLSSLDPKLTRKILLQILRLAYSAPRRNAGAPHKALRFWSVYSALYELREKSKNPHPHNLHDKRWGFILLTPIYQTPEARFRKGAGTGFSDTRGYPAHPSAW